MHKQLKTYFLLINIRSDICPLKSENFSNLQPYQITYQKNKFTGIHLTSTIIPSKGKFFVRVLNITYKIVLRSNLKVNSEARTN